MFDCVYIFNGSEEDERKKTMHSDFSLITHILSIVLQYKNRMMFEKREQKKKKKQTLDPLMNRSVWMKKKTKNSEKDSVHV